MIRAMLQLLKKAHKIYQEKGLREVLRRSFKRMFYLANRLRGKAMLLRFERTSIRMLIPSYHDFHMIHYVYSTESPLQKALMSELRADDVFWDVGANLGLYTCLVGKLVGNTGRVISFEPNPLVLSGLKANVAINGLENVSIMEIALWNKEDKMNFDMAQSKVPSLHGKVVTYVESNLDKSLTQVRTIRGDSLVHNGIVPPPDIVKIDVEGGEAEVLMGMKHALHSCRVVFIELHPAKGADRDVVEKTLMDAGLTQLEEIGRREQNVWLKASRGKGNPT